MMAGKRRKAGSGDRRDRWFKVRMSGEEIDSIRKAAAEKGVGMSRYVVESCEIAERFEAMRKDCERRPIVRELAAIRTEIWHIGHNVNQIARNTNRDLTVTVSDEDATVGAVRECARLLAEIREIVGEFDADL